MIAVSGCPRSGTSLMMDCLRQTFGQDRIVGTQWPQERELPKDMKQGRKSFHEWRKSKRPKRDYKDMNPYGFWECEYTVKGIRFNPRKPAPTRDKFCKIVSQGLAVSDPKYIDKVIFMLRHPRAVAKSQEKLVRPGFNDEGDPEKDGVKQKVHEARMFNNVTPAAIWWLLEFQVPYLIVEFDDLIEKPDIELERVREFLGEGEMSSARSVINPKLRRSIPQDREGREWEIADNIYEYVRSGDVRGIQPYLELVSKEPRDIESVPCARLQRVVAVSECNLCRTETNTHGNFMATAEKKGVDWYKTPCAYDCIVSDMTVEESIECAQPAANIGSESDNTYYVRKSEMPHECEYQYTAILKKCNCKKLVCAFSALECKRENCPTWQPRSDNWRERTADEMAEWMRDA